MSTPHRATPDQWRIINGYGAGSWISSTILELRARIEALVFEVESLSAANLSFNSEIEARIESLEAGATCPHIVSSDEGTSYCRLAEQNAPTTEDFLMGAPNALRAVRNFGREIGAAQIARSADSPPVKNQPATKDYLTPVPAGSLVERVAARIEYGIDANQDPEGIARAAIRQVGAWFVTITPRGPTTRALWRATASDVLHEEASR